MRKVYVLRRELRSSAATAYCVACPPSLLRSSDVAPSRKVVWRISVALSGAGNFYTPLERRGSRKSQTFRTISTYVPSEAGRGDGNAVQSFRRLLQIFLLTIGSIGPIPYRKSHPFATVHRICSTESRVKSQSQVASGNNSNN